VNDEFEDINRASDQIGALRHKLDSTLNLRIQTDALKQIIKLDQDEQTHFQNIKDIQDTTGEGIDRMSKDQVSQQLATTAIALDKRQKQLAALQGQMAAGTMIGKRFDDNMATINAGASTVGVLTGGLGDYAASMTPTTITQTPPTVTPTMMTGAPTAADIHQTMSQMPGKVEDPTTHDLLRILIGSVESLRGNGVAPQRPGGNMMATPTSPAINLLATGGGY
jgi:hypothetical protein